MAYRPDSAGRVGRVKLIPPEFAVRMIPHPMSKRKKYGRWHFQNQDKKNKTACGIIIASWRGDISTNKAWAKAAARRERWERKSISKIKARQMCKVCLGAFRAEDTVPQPALFRGEK